MRMSRAPYRERASAWPKNAGRRLTSAGPFSAGTSNCSVSTAGSPWHRPGIMIRVTSGGTSSRRAIQSGVMRAATVIFITAMSYANGSSARRSVSSSAGAASLPVTNRYRSAIAAPASPAVRRRGLAAALAEHELVRGSLERAALLRAPQHRVLDPPRHREVLVGDAAGGVVAQLVS